MISSALTLLAVLNAAGPGDLCGPRVPKTLAAGHYSGRFFQLGTAKGGSAQMNLSVQFQFRGKVEFDVRDDGTIKNAKAETKFSIYAAGTAAQFIAGGFNGRATGTLTHATGGTDRFSVSGGLSGNASVFVKTDDGRQKGGAGRRGAASGDTSIQFTVIVTACDGTSGRFTAPIFDETVAALSGKGFTVTRGAPDWTVRRSDLHEKRKAELEKDLAQAAQLLRGGGVDPYGRQAFARYWKMAKSIDAERSEQLRFCLAILYRRSALRDIGAAVDRGLARLAAVKADPRTLHSLRLEATALAKISNELVSCKLDLCGGTLHRKIIDGIAAKLKEVVVEAARRRYVLPDVVQVLAAERFTGALAPRHRDAAVRDLKAYIAQIKRNGPPRR